MAKKKMMDVLTTFEPLCTLDGGSGYMRRYQFLNYWGAYALTGYMESEGLTVRPTLFHPLSRILSESPKFGLSDILKTKEIPIIHDFLTQLAGGVPISLTHQTGGLGESLVLGRNRRQTSGALSLVYASGQMGNFRSYAQVNDIAIYSQEHIDWKVEIYGSCTPKAGELKTMEPDGHGIWQFLQSGQSLQNPVSNIIFAMEFADRIDWGGLRGDRIDGYLMQKNNDYMGLYQKHFPGFVFCTDAYYDYYMDQIMKIPYAKRALTRLVPVLKDSEYSALRTLLNPPDYKFLDKFQAANPGATRADFTAFTNKRAAYIDALKRVTPQGFFTDIWSFYEAYLGIFGARYSVNAELCRQVFMLSYKFTGGEGSHGFGPGAIPAEWYAEAERVQCYSRWLIKDQGNRLVPNPANPREMKKRVSVYPDPAAVHMEVAVTRVRGDAFWERWDPGLIQDRATYEAVIAQYNKMLTAWNKYIKDLLGAPAYKIRLSTVPFILWEPTDFGKF